MVEAITAAGPAVGGCPTCRSVFLVTPETPNCLLCGRPPAFLLPFPAAPPEPLEAPQPEPVEAPGSPPPEQEFVPVSDVLDVAIMAFLYGDPAADRETVSGLFTDAGADLAEATSAVSHLQAISELYQRLRERSSEVASPLTVSLIAPDEPQPEVPPEPPLPPEEEEDRTIASSP